MERKYIPKETIKMLLAAFVFAVTLVIAQTAAGYIMMKIMMKQYMSKEFIKNYAKMGAEVAQEIAEEMEDYL
jgi:hypothetical protein